MHLAIPDPTPDEPTVPAPSVCPTCYGEGWIGHILQVPCPECACQRCGCALGYGGLCEDCIEDLADDAYERSQDV